MSSEHADIAASLPAWAQIAYNSGILIVAVIAGAFGFFRKHASSFTGEHFADGGSLEGFGGDVKSIAESLRVMTDLYKANTQQDTIEREVKRRLEDSRLHGK